MELHRSKESGRTISELIAVLVIMLILTLGGLYIYERVMAKMGAKDLVDEIAAMATKNRLELTHSDRVSEKRTKRDGRGTLSSEPKNNGKDFSITVEPESKLVCDELTRTDLLANAGVNKEESVFNCPESVTFYFNGDFEEDIWVEDGSSGGHGGGRGRRRSEDDRCPDEHALECNEKGDSTLCESGYYVYNKVCIECPEHCVCDGKIILGAEKGYYKEGRVCKECGPNVLRCNGDKALACVNDYYLKDGECLKCPDNSTTTEYSQQSVPGTGCYCKAGHRLNGAKTGCEKGCDTSSDCPTEQPVCYEEKKDCDKCESNYGGTLHSCPTEKMPLCDEGRCRFCPGNTVWNATQKMCKECSETDLSQCPTDKPYCKNDEGTCVECLGNYGTGDGSCLAVDAPICQNNACVACPGETPHWNGTTCVECLEHTHCQEGKKCDDGNTCQACEQNTLCPTCPADTPYWDGTRCFSCLGNYGSGIEGACPTEERPVCNLSTHGCEACADQTPYWNGTNCVECFEDSQCTSNKCDLFTNICARKCDSYQDCYNGEYCQFRPTGDSDGSEKGTGYCQVIEACGDSGTYKANDGRTFWLSDYPGLVCKEEICQVTCHPDWWTAMDLCQAKGMKLVSVSEAPNAELGEYYGNRGFWTSDCPNSSKAHHIHTYKESGGYPLWPKYKRGTYSGNNFRRARGSTDPEDDDALCVKDPECPEYSSKTVTSWQIGTTGCYCEAGYIPNETGTACEAINGKICTTNADCGGTGSGYYCNFPVADCTKPATGTCVPLDAGSTKTYKGLEYLMSSDDRLSYWSAQNWCEAHGKKVLDVGSLGVSSGSFSTSDCHVSVCTGADWSGLTSAFGSKIAWTRNTRTGRESCVPCHIHFDSSEIDWDGRHAYHALCGGCPVIDGCESYNADCSCAECIKNYTRFFDGSGCRTTCTVNADCPSGTFCAFERPLYYTDKGEGSCQKISEYVPKTFYNDGQKCWIHSTYSMTWWSALNWCAAQGANNATLSTPNEVAQALGGTAFWLEEDYSSLEAYYMWYIENYGAYASPVGGHSDGFIAVCSHQNTCSVEVEEQKSCEDNSACASDEFCAFQNGYYATSTQGPGYCQKLSIFTGYPFMVDGKKYLLSSTQMSDWSVTTWCQANGMKRIPALPSNNVLTKLKQEFTGGSIWIGGRCFFFVDTGGQDCSGWGGDSFYALCQE